MSAARKGMPQSVLGLFTGPEDAVRAVDDLRRAGFDQKDLSVISGTPYPEGTFGLERPPSKIPFFSFGGAILGIIVGFSLAAGTAVLYPIYTGGKPIVALPPVGIVTYEMMMLGALVFTVLGFLISARIPTIKPHLWDVCISEGCLGVLVHAWTTDQAETAADSLRKAGAEDVRRFREATL